MIILIHRHSDKVLQSHLHCQSYRINQTYNPFHITYHFKFLVKLRQSIIFPLPSQWSWLLHFATDWEFAQRHLYILFYTCINPVWPITQKSHIIYYGLTIQNLDQSGKIIQKYSIHLQKIMLLLIWQSFSLDKKHEQVENNKQCDKFSLTY